MKQQTYLFSGLDGTLLTKRSLPDDKVTICETALLNTQGGYSVNVEGLGSQAHHPDAILLPDNRNYQHWRNDDNARFCDVLTKEMSQHPICLRQSLQRTDEFLRGKGIDISFGLELEFIALPEPLQKNVIASQVDIIDRGMYKFSSHIVEDVIEKIRKIGERVGIVWYSSNREYHPFQFEMTIGPLSASRTAEQFLIAKEIIRSEFAKISWAVSFLPLPINAGPGNGCHIHIGINNQNGKPDSIEILAKLLANNVKRYAAFFNPSVNSFRRLNIDEFKNLVDVGDTRNAVVRIVDYENGRIELRTPDAMMNIYAALLTILLSIKNGCDCNQKIEFCPLKYPQDLDGAIENLSTSTGEFTSEIGDYFCVAFKQMLQYQRSYYASTVSPIDFLFLEPQNATFGRI